MTGRRAAGDWEWVYESIIRSVPGVNTSRRVAIAFQFVAFEAALLLLSWYHGLPRAAIAGSVGVFIAVTGSVFMLRLAAGLRETETPTAYREILFGSGIEIVFGLLAFFVLVVYLFIYDPGLAGPTLVTELLGEQPPLLLSFLLLMVGWDVAYRIGVGWWASVVGLWRSVRFRGQFASPTRSRLARFDGLTIVFASVQLVLLPLLGGHPILQLAVGGHVFMVVLVSGLSVVVLRWRSA